MGVQDFAEAFHGGLGFSYGQITVLNCHEWIRNGTTRHYYCYIGWIVLSRNPAADLDVAVVVGFYGDVVLIKAGEFAIELVALLMLFKIEARDEAVAQMVG